MRLLKTMFAVLTIMFAPFAIATAHADKAPVYQSFFGTAIDGTDPISYFKDGRPIEGSSDITHEWNGATWHFTSKENRDLFAASPEKYAPQYGGYCSWAVSKGYTASTDPEAWDIVDGKLYLNYSKSVRQQWRVDKPGNIAAANANWPSVLK